MDGLEGLKEYTREAIKIENRYKKLYEDLVKAKEAELQDLNKLLYEKYKKNKYVAQS